MYIFINYLDVSYLVLTELRKYVAIKWKHSQIIFLNKDDTSIAFQTETLSNFKTFVEALLGFGQELQSLVSDMQPQLLTLQLDALHIDEYLKVYCSILIGFS